MQEGRTALSWACEGGHVEIVIALLEKGAATDMTDEVNLLCVHVLHVVTQNGVYCLVTGFMHVNVHRNSLNIVANVHHQRFLTLLNHT